MNLHETNHADRYCPHRPGVISLTCRGITYTTRGKVLQFGPLEATKKTEKTIPLPPVLGGFALAGGIVLIIIETKK